MNELLIVIIMFVLSLVLVWGIRRLGRWLRRSSDDSDPLYNTDSDTTADDNDDDNGDD